MQGARTTQGGMSQARRGRMQRHEIMAISGHAMLKELVRYTAARRSGAARAQCDGADHSDAGSGKQEGVGMIERGRYLAAGALLVMTLLGSSPGLPHASVVRTSPKANSTVEAPPDVAIFFSEKVVAAPDA